MKNSILVAVIATATMLTACASKKNDSQEAPKATALTKSTQSSMNKGAWLGACRPHRVGSHSFEGTEKIRLDFSNDYIHVSKLIFPGEMCSGDYTTKAMDLVQYSGTELSGQVQMVVSYTKEVRTAAHDQMIEQGALAGVYNLIFKNSNTISLKSKTDWMGLNGIYNRIPTGKDLNNLDVSVAPYEDQRAPKAQPSSYTELRAKRGF